MLSFDSLKRLVVDASPLIYLAKIDALDVFPLGYPALITEAVRREGVLPQAAYRFSEIAWIDEGIRVGRISVVALRSDEEEAVVDIGRRIPGLGLGERESIAVALARGWSAVLFDRRANRIAQALGVRVVGIVEVLFGRTADGELLERRLRRLASLLDMRIDALEQLLERVKERSPW